MPLSTFHKLQVGQRFWLRGEPCIKQTQLSYLKVNQPHDGEYHMGPNDEAQLTPSSPEKPNEDLKAAIAKIFYDCRIPLALLGPEGMKKLIALLRPTETLRLDPKPLISKPKKSVKAIAKKAAVKKAAKKSSSRKVK